MDVFIRLIDGMVSLNALRLRKRCPAIAGFIVLGFFALACSSCKT
jgi:hypothetical protein